MPAPTEHRIQEQDEVFELPVEAPLAESALRVRVENAFGVKGVRVPVRLELRV